LARRVQKYTACLRAKSVRFYDVSPERLEKFGALYAGRKGYDTFVDYEIKVYKGIYFLVFACPLRGGLIPH
jgi:hypothetical protein